MKLKQIVILIIFSLAINQCPDELVEDDCGDCWQAYCYCLSDHIPNFEISQNECEENSCWWIGVGGAYEPGDYEFCLFDPYWNASCTGCVDYQADNYDPNAVISCDDNCNDEGGDCCEYSLNNFNQNIINSHIESIYPNPFNPETSIGITMPISNNLKIEIYSLSGKKITTIHDKFTLSGSHIFNWNGKYQQSGIYLIKVSSNQLVETQLISLIK